MSEIASKWQLFIDTSPAWLFFRLELEAGRADPNPPLATEVWNRVDELRVYRVVFELGQDVILTSHLVGQLVLLHKRCHQSGGVLRICEFDTHKYGVIQAMQLEDRFPNYANRHDAVMGHRDAD